jgi:hypothetical protein
MGEAKRKIEFRFSIGVEDDGIVYKTSTSAELDARRPARKGPLLSQTPGAIRDRERRERLKAADPEYLNKERLRQKLIRANNPGGD